MAETAKERNQTTAIRYVDQFPTELLSMVLLNLPPKSVLRFKCVSKEWLSLITDPYFIDTYNNISNTRLGGVTIGIPPRHYDDCRFLIIDLNKPSRSRATVLDLKTFPPPCNRVTSMINGFICFYNWEDFTADIYLYNLSTRELFALPRSNIKRKSYSYFFCYLGYNPTNKEYKVLKICSDRKHEVFTLGSESWRGTEIHMRIPRPLSDRENEVCIDGILYYQATTENNSWLPDSRVYAFDVEHETCEFINCPKEMGRSPTLALIRGVVSLVSLTSAGGSYEDLESLVNFTSAGRSSNELKINVWTLFNYKGNDMMYKSFPLWSKQTITYSFGGIERLRIRCNQLGQIYRLINDGSGHWVIEFYDMATRMTKTLKLNNADGILFSDNFRFEPSKVPANISPLKYMKGRNTSAS